MDRRNLPDPCHRAHAPSPPETIDKPLLRTAVRGRKPTARRNKYALIDLLSHTHPVGNKSPPESCTRCAGDRSPQTRSIPVDDAMDLAPSTTHHRARPSVRPPAETGRPPPANRSLCRHHLGIIRTARSNPTRIPNRSRPSRMEKPARTRNIHTPIRHTPKTGTHAGANPHAANTRRTALPRHRRGGRNTDRNTPGSDDRRATPKRDDGLVPSFPNGGCCPPACRYLRSQSRRSRHHHSLRPESRSPEPGLRHHPSASQ